MLDQEFFKAQKEMLADLFSQAQAYTNLVIVAGYAGSFAIWSFLSKSLAPATNLITGLLLAVSISTYIAWEIFSMVMKQKSLAAFRRSVDDIERYAAEVARNGDRNQLLMRKFERYWPATVWIAAGSAVLAMVMLISAFCHGLIMAFAASFPLGEDDMDVMAILVFLGGAAAVIFGLLLFRVDARFNLTRARRMYAAALRDELLVMQKLFVKVADGWKAEGFVMFDLLDEIDFSRTSFQWDRQHLQTLDDADMKSRILDFYRETEITLRRLRHFQEQVHKLEQLKVDGHEEEEKSELLEKHRGWIQQRIEKLAEQKLQAEKISDQLFIRY